MSIPFLATEASCRSTDRPPAQPYFRTSTDRTLNPAILAAGEFILVQSVATAPPQPSSAEVIWSLRDRWRVVSERRRIVS
jgi:hypothetical protein